MAAHFLRQSNFLLMGICVFIPELLLACCPDLSNPQRKAVMQLVDRLVNKFMHPCVSSLRRQNTPQPWKDFAGLLHDEAWKLQRPS